MVLGELYLYFSLRGDEENIGGHQKKRERYWRTPREEKVAYLSQYDSFTRLNGGIGGLLEMLLDACVASSTYGGR